MEQHNYIKSNPIIYIRPQSDGYRTIALTGDSAWNLVNNPDTYVAPTYGTPALISPTNPNMLVHPNVFGNYFRRTGINGGYYNISAGTYNNSAHTVSNQIAEFGAASASTAYLIDHHTGLGWKWNVQGSKAWSGQTTDAYNLTWAGHSDWFLPSRNQLASLFNNYSSTTLNFLVALVPFNSGGTLKSSTPTFAAPTTQHHQWGSPAWVAARADATNDAAYFCRYHFTGQTQ